MCVDLLDLDNPSFFNPLLAVVPWLLLVPSTTQCGKATSHKATKAIQASIQAHAKSETSTALATNQS